MSKDTFAVTDDFPGKFKYVPFGEGCVDFSRHFEQLEKLGYCGPYTIEMWYNTGANEQEEIVRAKQWLEEQYRIGMVSMAY